MKESSVNNFGILIAYLVPGFTTVWGASFVSETLRSWLAASPADAPTVAGFLYVTIAAIAAGLTISTIRWAIIDTAHHRTGIRQPEWDFSRLRENLAAFDLLVEVHYRYYQFYANMLVALAIGYILRRTALGFWSAPVGGWEIGALVLAAIFFTGSRDTLRKYYTRGNQLLGSEALPNPALDDAVQPSAVHSET